MTLRFGILKLNWGKCVRHGFRLLQIACIPQWDLMMALSTMCLAMGIMVQRLEHSHMILTRQDIIQVLVLIKQILELRRQ